MHGPYLGGEGGGKRSFSVSHVDPGSESRLLLVSGKETKKTQSKDNKMGWKKKEKKQKKKTSPSVTYGCVYLYC